MWEPRLPSAHPIFGRDQSAVFVDGSFNINGPDGTYPILPTKSIAIITLIDARWWNVLLVSNTAWLRSPGQWCEVRKDWGETQPVPASKVPWCNMDPLFVVRHMSSAWASKSHTLTNKFLWFATQRSTIFVTFEYRESTIHHFQLFGFKVQCSLSNVYLLISTHPDFPRCACHVINRAATFNGQCFVQAGLFWRLAVCYGKGKAHDVLHLIANHPLRTCKASALWYVWSWYCYVSVSSWGNRGKIAQEVFLFWQTLWCGSKGFLSPELNPRAGLQRRRHGCARWGTLRSSAFWVDVQLAFWHLKCLSGQNLLKKRSDYHWGTGGWLNYSRMKNSKLKRYAAFALQEVLVSLLGPGVTILRRARSSDFRLVIVPLRLCFQKINSSQEL